MIQRIQFRDGTTKPTYVEHHDSVVSDQQLAAIRGAHDPMRFLPFSVATGSTQPRLVDLIRGEGKKGGRKKDGVREARKP